MILSHQPRRARCTKRRLKSLEIHVSGTHDAGIVHDMFENLLVVDSLASLASLSVLDCLIVSLSKVI